MVLSRREKYILYITGAVLLLLFADRYAFTPLLNAGDQIRAYKQQLLGELNQANSLFNRQKLMSRKWQEMIDGGLKHSVSDTESEILHAVRNWSQQCRFVLSSIKPDRINGDDTQSLHEMNFMVTGTGSMESLGRFLWGIENTKLPLRIIDVQMSSRRENAEEMSLQLRLSTIYYTPIESEQDDDTPADNGEELT